MTGAYAELILYYPDGTTHTWHLSQGELRVCQVPTFIPSKVPGEHLIASEEVTIHFTKTYDPPVNPQESHG